MSAGKRAMATALVLQAYGHRHSDGRILNYKAPEEPYSGMNDVKIHGPSHGIVAHM